MRKKEKEITEPSVLEAILQRAPFLHLGMCADGIPYVLPMNFGYQENRIYLHTGREGKKIDILQKNPNVCFQIDMDTTLREPDEPKKVCGFGMLYTSLVGFGTARITHDFAEVEEGLRIVTAHYAHDEDFSFPEEVVRKTAVVVIEIKSMTGRQNPPPNT